MKSLILIAAFAVVVVANAEELVIDKECMRGCPYNLDPVCATNGERLEVFDNECMMEIGNCEAKLRHQHPWTRSSMCGKFRTDLKPHARFCPAIFKPVCGFDGKHYRLFDNDCLFKSQQQEFGQEWTLATMPHCLMRSNENLEKDCPTVSEPVCGSNGKTTQLFLNDCIFKQFQNFPRGKDYYKTFLNFCAPTSWNKVDLEKRCMKPCTLELAPICGFDGHRFFNFGNVCDMEVQNCLNNNKYSVFRIGDCPPV